MLCSFPLKKLLAWNKNYKTYGHYTADGLDRITCLEKPWNQARINCVAGAYSRNLIALKDMRDYYGERAGKSYKTEKPYEMEL